MAARREHIPEAPEELTAEWLTAALRARGVLRSASVTALEREVLGEGEGFIGQILRLHLRLDRPEAGVPPTLIAKLPTRLDHNRRLGEFMGAYEREIRFYEELAGEVRLATPRCFYSAMDPNPLAGREERALRFAKRIPGWALRLAVPFFLWSARRSRRRYVLLLEDLAPAHVGDQIAGCDPAQAEHILRQLATAQAALWNRADLASRWWLARIDLVPRVSQWLLRRNRRLFFEQFRGRLGPEIPRLADWLEANGLALMQHLGSPPLALMHGDLRLDNLFFGGPAGPDALTAVDWQGVGLGRPALDVAYFLAGNLDTKVVRAAESDLVRAYHDELLSRGVHDYPFAECWRDHQLSKLFLLHRWIGGAELIDLSQERGQVLLQHSFDRLCALLPEGDPDALLPGLSRGAAASSTT